MARSKKKRLPIAAEKAKAGAAAMANATKGRARTFTDRKKATARNACRGKVDQYEN